MQQGREQEIARRSAAEEHVKRIPEFEAMVSDLNARLEAAYAKLVALETSNAQLSTSLDKEREAAGEKLRLLEEARAQLSDAFSALCSDALRSNNRSFLELANATGQEGLDFHHYCHAVVHWNLPANPVDLEQREGRVHRYKGHAVRKNVADAHGRGAESFDGAQDPWQAMFEAARGARESGGSDLVPYWVYPRHDGAAIERHVPALPLSRDAERYSALRRSLAVYRTVFGQSRQEELASYLLSNLPPDERLSLASELRINLEPRAAGGSGGSQKFL